MATLITHFAVGAALGACMAPRELRSKAVVAGALVACLPDLDVFAFALHIPYSYPWGHRGMTHSLLAALLMALGAAAWLRSFHPGLFLGLLLAAASHTLLDALTNGGLGVAFFAPWDHTRYFFPWTPIKVSPIGIGFFSERGLEVLWSELKWVWLPLAALAFLWRAWASRRPDSK